MTLVIRAANVAGGARLQIVIYDPNLHDAPTRNALVAHGDPLVECYRKLLSMITDWVRETAAFPPVLEGWYGGRMQGVKLEEVGLDAVGLAALWINKLVSGGALPPMAEDTMTADEERLLWEEKGFVPIERLLN
ncbi:uncharacterized protein E0L32_010270 [Thyridium curvatum]|uniref:Uncharacterized protein n=1 Tax=Thyridium curvatum TaxID=1093900 RepID=A0A507AV14_9PEZI|nr:uncharacterized protein E0L32_010270 [Thyridium curvatum]TPX08070.1 hypothetical protein E0L32_010270 [Thyridium curvatum]